MRSDIVPGGVFPDYALPDHTGAVRTLSELQGRDPLILTLARGHYCPKEHQQHLELAAFQSEDGGGLHPDRHDLHRRAPHAAGVPRVGRRAVDVPLRPGPDRPAGPRHPGVHRPRAQPDDPAHARAQAGAGHPQRLQRLLVLGSPLDRRPLARPAGGDARDPPGLGSEQRRGCARRGTAGDLSPLPRLGPALGHTETALRAQDASQLAAAADAELREHLAQVPLDRARAEEELRADLRVRQAVASEPGDLRLLRGQVVAASRPCACAPSRRWPAARGGRARRTPRRPSRSNTSCAVAQLRAGVDPAVLPPQPLAVQELGAGQLDPHAGCGPAVRSPRGAGRRRSAPARAARGCSPRSPSAQSRAAGPASAPRAAPAPPPRVRSWPLRTAGLDQLGERPLRASRAPRGSAAARAAAATRFLVLAEAVAQHGAGPLRHVHPDAFAAPGGVLEAARSINGSASRPPDRAGRRAE